MANRTVLLRDLVIDGVGDPGIGRGVITIEPLYRLPFAGLGILEKVPLFVPISGVAVPKDLPVIEVGDHNCLVVKGYFGPNNQYGRDPLWTEYVLNPAGAGTVNYEALPRVDPATLGPVVSVPSEVELRIRALETGGGPGSPVLSVAGRTGAVNLVVTDIGGITEPGLSALQVTGADLPARKAAFQAAVGGIAAANTNLTGTTSVVNLVVSGTTSFVDGSIAQADVNGLVAALATLTTAVGAVPALSDLNHIPYYLHTVSGAYPARPDTHLTPDRVVIFDDPNVVPANTGVITGGGGMVPGLDMWIS